MAIVYSNSNSLPDSNDCQPVHYGNSLLGSNDCQPVDYGNSLPDSMNKCLGRVHGQAATNETELLQLDETGLA